MVRVTCEFIALKTPEAPVSGVFAFGRLLPCRILEDGSKQARKLNVAPAQGCL